MVLASFRTILPIDCVDACSDPFETLHLVAVGCYSLEQQGKRAGAFYFGVCENQFHPKPLKIYWPSYQHLPYGLLDIKLKKELHSFNDYISCGIGSDGSFHFNSITLNNSLLGWQANIQNTWTLSPLTCQSNIIGVAMDLQSFYNQTEYSNEECLVGALTMSDGSVYHSSRLPSHSHGVNIMRFDQVEMQCIKAHSAETWSVCIDSENKTNQIMTGADDCLMKFWDLRYSLIYPTVINNYHTMGVTALASYNQFVLSGSYNGTLNVWDKRNMKVPYALYTTQSKEGIWRIKLQKTINNQLEILLAATHGGSEVCSSPLHFDSITCNISNNFHTSMVYGIASLCSTNSTRGTIAPLYVSGSFYDRYLCFWK